MESILNFSTELNIEAFDEVVRQALDATAPNKTEAENTLVKFKDHPSAWTKVDFILKNSKSQPSRFFALQILEEVIKSKWVLFSEEQKNSLKAYVIQDIIKRASEEQVEVVILKKFNIILVEILKKEWPKKWPTFINDLITASQSANMEVCRNSLEILKIFNEEVFVFSEDKITTVRKRILRNQLKIEFVQIFQLIKTIFECSKRMNISDTLLETTFSVFQSFAKHMPISYIINTDIVEYILSYINSKHSIAALYCIYEIVELGRHTHSEEKQKILLIHKEVINFMKMYFVKFQKDKVYKLYENMDDLEKEFIMKCSMVLTSLYTIRLDMLEEEDLENTKYGLKCMVEFSRIQNSRMFKDILEMWNNFIFELYAEYPYNTANASKILRRTKYVGILESLVEVLVYKMPRPEEVLIVENEYGEIVKEKMVETEKIEFYLTMKKCLFHLSFLTKNFMTKFFLEKLERQLNGNEWGWKRLNRICWSIGTISGSFPEDEESVFFVEVLKDLLALCEIKCLKEDKAVIASNIMYLVGQYHRFLMSNMRFLKTVVKKLFEFMDETHEGIQDMACDTFLMITGKCAKEFLVQRENNEIYLLYILKNLKEITKSLEFYQKRIVYECLCAMIKEVPSSEKKLPYIDLLFSSFLEINILNAITPDFLKSMSKGNLKEVCHVLRSYSLVYKMVPEATVPSFSTVFPRLFEVFEICNVSLENKNQVLIKSEIISLLISAVSSLSYLPSGEATDTFINLLFEKIIFDFRSNQFFKDPLLLSLTTEILENVKFDSSDMALRRESFIVSTLVQPSIPLVMKSEENDEICRNYFLLMESLMKNAFETFFPLLFSNTEVFDSFYSSILYGFLKKREDSDTCLSIIFTIFKKNFALRNYYFYQKYFITTLENIFGIIFDKDKIYGFNLQCSILAYMFKISNEIPSLDNTNPNSVVLDKFMDSLFLAAFKNVTVESLSIFKVGLFELCCDENVFRDHVADFKVKIYEYGCNDDIEEEMLLEKERKSMIKG